MVFAVQPIDSGILRPRPEKEVRWYQGYILATADVEGTNTARLWEAATGREIATLSTGSIVMAIAFSPDGRMLATGSENGIARLWEVATGREVATLRGHQHPTVSSVAFSPDGRLLATGSWDKMVRLWKVGQDLIDLACARVHDLPLSEDAKQRFGIEDEWCTPEVSSELRAKLRLHEPETISLGERESDTKRLQEAVEAFRAALKEYTRERAPRDWARTQNNLGGLSERMARPVASGFAFCLISLR